MSKRAGWALAIAALAIFVLLNRAAYKGYFQDDDLGTLGWARTLPPSEFLKYLVTPRLVLHGLHLLNIWLVWLDAKPLGEREFAAPGCQAVQWPAPPIPLGKVKINIHVAPPYPAPKPDLRSLGISMKGFGFIP